MNKKRTGRFIALALLLAGLCSTAQAANKNWVGNTDTNFNTTNNWSAAFVSGDSMIFTTAGTAGANLYNNLASGTTVLNMTFNTNATSGSTSAYIINGNAIALTGNIAQGVSSTNNIVINLPMTIASTRTVTARGSITLGGKISGAGGLTKGASSLGTSILTLTGTNDFTGDVTLASGTGVTQVSKDENLGAGANINLAQNTTLKTTGSFATSKTITLAASGANQDISVNSGTTLTLNSKITGGAGGTMRINGLGTVVYAAANDHSAGTTVAGSLKLTGAGTLNNGSARVGMNAGSIDLGGTSQTIGALTFVGGASYISNGNLTVTSMTNSSFVTGISTVSANLHGAGATLIQNQGTLILNGVNDFTGATTVTSTGTLSRLFVNGSTLSDITVGSWGTLGGSGTVHAVTVNAGGVLSAANTNSPGTLTFTADASLEAGSTNIMEIYSASLYDVLKGSVSNTLTLAGENIIDFTGWTTPGVANGTTFALFQNWSTINTTGGTFTFVNLGNLGLTDDQILVATGAGFAVSSKSAPNILLLY